MTVLTPDAVAQQIGYGVLRRARRIAIWLPLAGAVFVGGFVGFGIFGNSSTTSSAPGPVQRP